MDMNLMLVDGDKIELYKTEKDRYKAVITEAITERMYLVPVPMNKMKPMEIYEGDIIYIAYFRERGRFVMETVARTIVKRGEVRYVVLDQIKEPYPKQLREFFRVPVDVKVIINKLVTAEESTDSAADPIDDLGSVELETVSAKDLSVTGLSIESQLEYKSGERFMLTLHFNDKRTQLPPLIVFSESMRVESDYHRNIYRVGMKFIGLTNSMSDQLAKYLLAVQQKQIIRKKLIEGN